MQFIVILVMDQLLVVAMIFLFQMDLKVIQILMMVHKILILLKIKKMLFLGKKTLQLMTMKFFNWKLTNIIIKMIIYSFYICQNIS